MAKKNLTHAELQQLLNNVPTPSLPISKPKRKAKKPKINGRSFTREEDSIHFECIQLLKNEFPSVEWISNILDGARLGMLVRKHTKGMRNREGTSDIIILEPRKGFHGMCLEIKTASGTLSKEQKDFLHRMALKNYHAIEAYGIDECFELIREYLE
ncbi:MAG TPA: VRR-NUC domain-containing protein [Leptospiraceae bacterium]|nr:VRR-NUC domain-containing protein [Leptospiraceae bacterium]HNC59788.1 VRR-NUC domain-containing protein [Leptospiraceae bacterium]HNE56233.1 VRR-NUC domain-containing protein [Leptospiraceae bacterium]HNF57571.1 VRR-NUC domain-containing protein [Leptospiraceae bacterium]HNM92123.1 VRR-NUC domain-containing protein [Leptospiraceae bacterium]